MNGTLLLVILLAIIAAGDGGLVLLHMWMERTEDGRAVEAPHARIGWRAFRPGQWGVGGWRARGDRCLRRHLFEQPDRRGGVPPAPRRFGVQPAPLLERGSRGNE